MPWLSRISANRVVAEAFMVGRIITVATQKGGAGKTTVTRVISTHLAAQRWKVAVVDADPNEGFTDRPF